MLSFLLTLIEEESDKELFTGIYKNYEKQMWYAANEILKDNQLAEDAVQNTFMSVIRNIETIRKLKNDGYLQAYLIRSAKNSALDIARKRKKEAAILNNREDGVQIEDIEFGKIDDNDHLMYLLNKLPSCYVDVLTYRYVFDLPEKMIAENLHLNLNTVRQRIFRGKKLFSEIYQKEMPRYEAK